LYRLNAKIACPISRFFPDLPQLPARDAPARPRALPGPAQPQIIPAGQPSLQVAPRRMIAAADNGDFC
jgi:hypothetical protein